MTTPGRPAGPARWPPVTMIPGQRYTFADHAADHLAWRKASFIATLTYAAWLGAACLASIVMSPWWEGSYVFALVMGPVTCLILGILYRQRRKWVREPIPRTFQSPDHRGVTTTREAVLTVMVPAAIFLLFGALTYPAQESPYWCVLGAGWLVVFGSCFGPGLLIRARRHKLLAHTLATDPAAQAAWDDIEAHYPEGAPFPFR